MSLRQHRVGRIIPGTFAHVIRQYLASDEFKSKAEGTQKNYRRVLAIAEMEDGLGGCSVQVVRPSIVQAFLDGLAHKTGIQSNARIALAAVERFAVIRDLVPHPFMTGTRVIGSEDGHEPWPAELVALAQDEARSDIARAVTIAVHTGQRISDVVRMAPTDIEEKENPYTGSLMRGINVTQRKTGVRLWIPIMSDFEAIIATWERRPGPFLTKPRGAVYTSNDLSNAWWREVRENKKLKPILDAGLVMHGLRSTCVVRLRKRGLNALQISSIVGMSLPMVERYCRLADKSEIAMAAVHFLGTGGEHKSSRIQRLKS